ncbi:hypothetical protein SCALM49S_06417 [Streptomyces californicus]
MIIDVFPDQEGDGTFAVWALFDGADSFALDRRLGDERQLFAVVHGERGWEPAVPARPGILVRTRVEYEDVQVAHGSLAWIEAGGPADAAHRTGEATVPGGTQDHHPLGPQPLSGDDARPRRPRGIPGRPGACPALPAGAFHSW